MREAADEGGPVIDAHHHVWDLAVRDQDWITGPGMAAIRRSFSVDDLRPLARAAGVTATVLVQTVTHPAETPELLAVAAADPLVAGVVGWTDLTSAAVTDDLARLEAGPGGAHLTGIRHQVQSEPDPDWLRRPGVLRGLRAVAAAGLCYDLVVLPHQLPAAIAAADAVPGLAFVLDHAGKPGVGGDLRPWAADIRALAARPNVTCKLSGLVTE
ncbi:MAG: amidohydrolase family protein, partial [Actinomycetia bacterium]|nr:amidohydrolase family protein [Actinomycetes bacterium]